MDTPICDSCPHFAVLCNLLDWLLPYEEIRIPKTAMQRIPECFEETLLGEPKGSLRQFVGLTPVTFLNMKRSGFYTRTKLTPDMIQ
jgi:hypothetical protein